MSAPIAFATTRHRCPYCRKSWAHKATAAKHMTVCFADPERRTCKTCAHDVAPVFTAPDDYEERHCAKGLDQGPSCIGCGEHPEACGCDIGYRTRPATQLRVLCPAWEVSRDGE